MSSLGCLWPFKLLNAGGMNLDFNILILFTLLEPSMSSTTAFSLALR